MLWTLKFLWWLSLRGAAAIGGGLGYAVSAIELPQAVRQLQVLGNQAEDRVINAVPLEYQAVAGALGIGDGLPLLAFVLAALALFSVCSAGCGRCWRALQRQQRQKMVLSE